MDLPQHALGLRHHLCDVAAHHEIEILVRKAKGESVALLERHDPSTLLYAFARHTEQFGHQVHPDHRLGPGEHCSQTQSCLARSATEVEDSGASG
jgi:hypothetical protein